MLPDLERVEPAPGRSFTWEAFDLPSFPYRWHFHALRSPAAWRTSEPRSPAARDVQFDGTYRS